MKRTLGLVALIAGFGVILSACNDYDSPVAVSPHGSAYVSNASDYLDGLRATGIEGAFQIIAKDVPAFAGFHFDNGNLVISVTKLQDATSALSVARSTPFVENNYHGRRQTSLMSSPVVFREVTYSFSELREWRDKSSSILLGLEDVVFVDLDEKRNELTVGLTTLSGSSSLKALLSDLNVPLEAVRFELTEPVRYTSTLSDSIRPLRGGIKILPSGCTYGFNAVLNGTDYTVVASHCTDEPFALDSDAFYQHGEFIGNEDWDRNPYECPSGTNGSDCRASDAALVEQTSGPSFGFGEIARTQCCGDPDNGSKTIDSSQPYFEISGKGSSVEDEYLEKMGITTGWTYGQVNRTCVDFSQDGQPSDFRLYCQDTAFYGALGGDSGAPVFRWNINDTITLIGIHWGTTETESVYSPIANIEFDINFPWWSYELDVN